MAKLLIAQNYIAKNNKNKIISEYKKTLKNSNNTYEFFILTTAITRPDLHSISFTNYRNVLSKDIKIKWVINIDYVNFNKYSNPDIDIENTKNNIIKIFDDYENIDFDFILNKEGNFNRAVRNIANKCGSLISSNCKGVFYLEDDWISTKKVDLLKEFLSDQKNDAHRYYNDGSPPKISNQPVIMKPFVWYYVFFKKLNDSGKEIDPEKISQIGNKELKKNNIIIYQQNFFKDIGRDQDLNDDNTVRGWFQKSASKLSMTYVFIDKLLLSEIFIISKSNKNKLNEIQLRKILEKSIIEKFMSEITSKIMNKFDKEKEFFYKNYARFNSIKLDSLDLKYVYDHIDSVIETGA